MKVIKSTGYDIICENDSFSALKNFLKASKHSATFILCDENTLQHCLPVLVSNCPLLSSAEIIEVESGEQSKDIQISALIWQTLMENKADRNSLLINLGGGVISDLGGFSASLYKRGISFIHIPTTLLAMADASVGGKTAVDFLGVKNLIGNFSLPALVYTNPVFLKTLPQRHFYNGLAEVYKVALVSDYKLWKKLKSEKNVNEIIQESIRLKNKIVLKDPFDKSIRQSLNFGHTIGHALESLFISSPGKLLHGEAIIVGMCIESHLAYQKKLISKSEYAEISQTLLDKFSPPAFPDLDANSIVDLLIHDKKAVNNKSQYALVNKIGGCKINVTVTSAQLEKAFEAYNKLSNGGN